MKRCIVLMMKWPEAGKVKTRLAADLGHEAAVALARSMAEDMLDALKWVEDADLFICFTPNDRGAEFKQWLGPERQYLSQRGPDLGRRMKNAFFSAFHKGYEQVVLLGSDIPDMDDNDLRQAFEHLENTQSCVLGPSEDGGYWLIGFDAKGCMDAVFLNIEWGAADLLEQTVRRLEFDERNVGYVTTRQDVDTADDLRRVIEGGRLKGSSKTLKLAKKALG